MKTLIATLMLAASIASADNMLHVTWQNPTTRESGAPFPRSELAQIQIDVDGVNIGTFKSGGIDKQSYDYRLKCWKAGRVVGIMAIDTNGLKSKRATVLLPARAGSECVK